MRPALAFLAVGVVLSVGCSSENPAATTAPIPIASTSSSSSAPTTAPPAPTTTTTVPRPTEVVIGTVWPENLNPLVEDGQIVMEINQAIGIGLTETDGATLELIPDLAVEIPSVANGGVVTAPDGTTTVTFRLRDEAVWEDGTPISGDDVVFTFEAIMALDDRPSLREPYEAITAIEARPKTVTLTFDAPTLAFETMFPFVIPRHQVEGTDPAGDWLEEPWMSAGPFRFESWEGDELHLVRNQSFWKTDPGTGDPLPRLDRLVFKWIPETDALVDAFAAGEIDVVRLRPWQPLIDRLTAIDGVEVTVRDSPIWEQLAFQFGSGNRNEASLNDRLEFRRAVAHLIDPDALIDLGVWAARDTIDSILDLHGVASDEPWSAYPYDPAEARRLLADLCAEMARDCDADPPRIVFSTTANADERPAVGRLLVDLLGDAGIEVELDLEDSSLFFGSTLTDGTWDLGMWAWAARPTPAGLIETLELFDPEMVPDGDDTGTNYSRWGDPAVCCWPPEGSPRYGRILDEMRATADRDRFAELAREAEQILADQVVFIPLLTRGSVGAVWADRVEGYVHSPWLDTWNVEEWRIRG